MSSEMRTSLFTIFSILAAVGCTVFLFLKGPCCSSESVDTEDPVEFDDVGDNSNKGNDEALLSKEKSKKVENSSTFSMVIDSIRNAFKLLVTREMLLSTSLFVYSGYELSFFSGVYTTAIGNSKNLEDSTAIVGLVGMTIGVGEVLGGGLFVFGGKIMDNIKRSHLLIG